MVKPTQCLQARLRLTTKQVGGGYYKGNRTGSMGFFGPGKGRYIIDWRKVRTYVVPEGLAEFKLSPFVTKRMEPTRSVYTKSIASEEKGEITFPRGYNGKDFLKEWSEENEWEVDDLKSRETDKQENVEDEAQTAKDRRE